MHSEPASRHRAILAAGIVVAAVIVVVLLAVAVSHAHGPTTFDTTVGPHLRAADGSTRLHLAEWIGWLGSPVGVIVIAVLGAVICVGPARRPALALLCLGAPALAALATTVTKELIARPAPAADGAGWSFPSGHTAGAAAIGAAAVLVVASVTPSWRWRTVAAGIVAVYVAAVAVARIEVGAHFPTDVVAGVAVGLVAAVVVGAAVWTLEGHVQGRIRQ
jgi:undecaprenyl-diphosphatase